ncbi:hypothetical protein GCM10027073_31040 [Streptomyces chlorus]|uniref:DUF7224 domain-containing protein n=1 Tax=Streptomyces chlorus TaxID=887452 RepID=A0ABW1E458_9ACTN
MRLRTSLRSSSALWALPFVIALTVLYYVIFTRVVIGDSTYGYAPALVSSALRPIYAFTYATAACLGAWEAGRLRQAAVWDLAPARSRFRIAALALVPVLGIVWLMLLLPVTVALVRNASLPTAASLAPLAMGLSVSAAYTVIGFAVGQLLRPLFAAPLTALGVYLLVGFSASTDSFWVRHILGQYPEMMTYGEQIVLSTLIPHLLPACGVALALALLWVSWGHWTLRSLVACVLVAATTGSAYNWVKDWNYNPPISAGNVTWSCQGESPKVCMPADTASRLPAVRRDVTAALTALESADIIAAPRTVVDSIADGRYGRRSTDSTWRIPLTEGADHGRITYLITRAAVRYPCAEPDTTIARQVYYWAATKTGTEDAYIQRLETEGDFTSDKKKQLQSQVGEVLALGRTVQNDWYEQNLAAACAGQA